MSQDHWFLLFITSWVAVSAVVYLFFWHSRDVVLKRRVFPWVIWGGAALFAWFIFHMFDDIPWWFLAAIPVIVWLNLRNTRFCDACSHPVFFTATAPHATCRRCGAAIARGV